MLPTLRLGNVLLVLDTWLRVGNAQANQSKFAKVFWASFYCGSVILPVVLLVIPFVGISGYRQASRIEDHGVLTTGQWERRWTITDGVPGGIYVEKYVSYSYQVDGSNFLVEQRDSQLYDEHFRQFQPVTIIYDTHDPGFSRIAGSYATVQRALILLVLSLMCQLPGWLFFLRFALPKFRNAITQI